VISVFEQPVDFVLNSLKVIQAKIHDCVADVRNVIELFQAGDDHVTHDAGGYFLLAKRFQPGLDFTGEPINIGRWDWPFGTRNPQALQQLVPVECFAGSILLLN
jgi:hypothetical protein